MTYATTATAPGLLSRLPVPGFISRHIAREVNIVFYLLAIALAVLVLAVKAWGLVVLAMSALALVPVVFALLIAVTRG